MEYVVIFVCIQMQLQTVLCKSYTVIPRLTSDPSNEFFG